MTQLEAGSTRPILNRRLAMCMKHVLIEAYTVLACLATLAYVVRYIGICI